MKSGHNLWPWFEVHLESERSGANNTWFSDNLHLGHLVDLMMKVMLMMMVVPMVVATTKVWGEQPVPFMEVKYYQASNYITKPCKVLRSIIKLD